MHPIIPGEAPVEIRPLADVPEHVAELAKWYFTEWRRFYGQKTIDEVRKSIRNRARRDDLPFALVATHHGRPIGTVSLKVQDMDDDGVTDRSPWLAGLYVLPDYRKSGVGSKLVQACLKTARLLNYRNVFLWTPSAAPFFARLGWVPISTLMYKGEQVTIMQWGTMHAQAEA